MAKYVKTEQGYQEIKTTVAPVVNQEIETTVAPMVGEKMDKNNPVGTGSFSMGRKAGSVIGTNSHAEGDNTTASGDNSHAEGFNTTASSRNQHAQGKYNVEDSQGKYAHIVGNGTSVSARSNAHTLDWNGNAWYAGDVYVGSTSGVNKDEGSKKLATEEYVDSKQDTLIQSGAAVGQIAKITAVDSNGKPTAWEAVDMPSGGGWDLITDITLTEDGGGAAMASVTRNDKGEEFEYRQCMVCLSGKVIDGWPKGAYIRILLYENNDAAGNSASSSLARLAAGEGGTEYKTTVEMSIFGNLIRLIACGGSSDNSSLIIRGYTSIDTFRSIQLSSFGNSQWVIAPLAAGGRIVIYGRK